MADIAGRVMTTYPDVKIMIGGASLNADFASSINAHFYGEDARAAVNGAHQLVGLEFTG